MRKILVFILVTVSLSASAQYITLDTTLVSNIKARITYKPGQDSMAAFFVIHGIGAVGTDTSKIALFGPHFWLRNSSWDGSVTLGNEVHYPAYITLLLPAKWVRPKFLKPAINALLARFPQIRRYARHAMGVSMGSWEWDMYCTYQPTPDDYSYFTTFQSIVSIQGVGAARNNPDATLPVPQRYGHWVAYSRKKTGYGSYLGFEQVNDGRNVWERTTNINDSFPGAAHLIWTNFCEDGNCGKHHSFNRYYDPSENNWTAKNLLLVNSKTVNKVNYPTQWLAGDQNIYQWALRQGDTTVSKQVPVRKKR